MKETGKIYAMKVMNKNQIMESDRWKRLMYRRKQYEHTLAERRIMQDISHPFLVWYHSLAPCYSSLRYAFQSQTKLYLVMDFFNGGELYHYLSMGRFSEVWLCILIHAVETCSVLCSGDFARHCSSS